MAVIFETFAHANLFLLWAIFAIAVVLGGVIAKTNFCTMGAVSDIVNMGDWSRMRAWLLAIAIAVIGVAILEPMSMVAPDGAFPPYRAGQIVWIENIFGGFAFGVGMSLAGGCANKCLTRIGGGNLKSVVVFLIIAPIAYFMVRPFPGSDQTLYSLLFFSWTQPLSINVGPSQDLGTLLAGVGGAQTVRQVVAAVIGLALIWFVFKSREFRGNRSNLVSGLTVGLGVLLVWYLTSNTAIDVDGEIHSPLQFATDWDFYVDTDEGKPADTASLAPQSLTFINPIGQSLGAAFHGFDPRYLTYALMAMLGVVAGAFGWSMATRNFRIEWFGDRSDVIRHIVGAILMGFGGVLGMGCTIGQGITGVSTLAIGSFLTISAIIFGCVLSLKVQLYRVYYDREATFLAAIVSSLVDLKVLPRQSRMLDAID